MKRMNIKQWMLIVLLSVSTAGFCQDGDPDAPPGDPGAPVDGYVLPMVLMGTGLACLALWKSSRKAGA